jgi:UDP-glucose 4-epimerase
MKIEGIKDSIAYTEALGFSRVFNAYANEVGSEDIMEIGFNVNSGIVYIALENGISICSCMGNDVEFTVAELAEKVRGLIGTNVKIDRKPLPLDDPKVRKPDLTQTRKDLGWSPKIDLNEGLEKTIPYFEGQLRLHKS